MRRFLRVGLIKSTLSRSLFNAQGFTMSQAAITQTDVVVIGGGPAGATTSTLLAQHGCKVQLFEREKFPRFHIGESLIPETYWVLKRLNMLEKMQASHFVKKYSVQFVNAGGKLSAPFYFWDNKPHECSQTWRSEERRVGKECRTRGRAYQSKR